MNNSENQKSTEIRKDWFLLSVYVFFLFVGLFFAYQSISFPSFNLSNDVGAARFPLVFSLSLSALSLLGAIYTFTKPVKSSMPKGIGKASVGIGLNILTLAAIPWLGFYISCFIFSCTLMVYLGIKNKARILMVSIAQTIAIYLVFQLFLHVPLPVGQLIEQIIY